jgi:ABC-type antimicrobial peptide transport system permease subunit
MAGIPHSLRQVIVTYLLALMAGEPADVAELVSASACSQCIPPSMELPVITYLLAVVAGLDPDPVGLVAGAKQFLKLTEDQHSMIQARCLQKKNSLTVDTTSITIDSETITADQITL